MKSGVAGMSVACGVFVLSTPGALEMIARTRAFFSGSSLRPHSSRRFCTIEEVKPVFTSVCARVERDEAMHAVGEQNNS